MQHFRRFASSAGPKSALVVGSMGQLGYDAIPPPTLRLLFAPLPFFSFPSSRALRLLRHAMLVRVH